MGILLSTSHRVAAQDTNAVELSDNAALDYWRAIALLRQPTSPEELEILDHIARDVPDLPPAIFGIWPDAGQWLLDEQPSLRAIQAGSRKARCDFGVRVPGKLGLNLEHLAPLRALTDRALEGAKAYEYADNLLGTSSIYVALLKLSGQLDQDQTIESGVLATDLVQDILDGIVGFTSREPPAAAITILTTYFAGAPPTLFHLNEYILTLADHTATWLQEDMNMVEARLAALYRDAPHKPAVQQLMTLSAEAKAERLGLWIEGYRAHMTALAEACAKPYQVGLYQIIDLEKEVEADRKAPGKAENPLIPLLAPTMMEKAYERFLLAEAHIIMADILCAATLYRDDLDTWPPDLEALSKFVSREFRRDPFTGGEIQYKLKKRMPIIGIRVPKWLAKQPGIIYRASLATRQETGLKKVLEIRDDILSKARKDKMRELQKGAVPVGR